MDKKKTMTIILLVILLVIVIGVVGCYFINKNTLSSTSTSVNDLDTNIKLDVSDEDIEWSNYENREISLSKSIVITEEGIYNLSGEIDDGLVTVKTSGDVKITLNNVNITNSSGPAIYIESANTVVISTLKGTTNVLVDGLNYSGYDEDVEGVIYSKDDLVLEGDGTLVVNSNKGDAIVCKDDLKFNSGIYDITSKDDGIRGKDSVYIVDGIFTITALGDGIKSTNDTDTTKGYVKIENGTYNITSTLDGIQAETKVLISNGTFNITTGGGALNSSDGIGWGNWENSNTSSDSANGIKTGDNIVLTGGIYNFDTTDDAIHSNNYVGISGGTYAIISGDDGIHADMELVIDGGIIDIMKSYEGFEAQTITINNGDIKVTSNDDGLNAAGGNDGSAINRPGASNSTGSIKSILTINGGNIYVDASGDGLDANGSIYINGGFITVDGPTNSGNGALDYDSECNISGGTLIAVGASGMTQGISSISLQYGVLINFTSSYPSGTAVTIVDSSNNEIMSYESVKSFSSMVFSSDKLMKGTYTIMINESAYQTFTIDSISTVVGSSFIGGGNNHGGRK